jgi:hypothetical protein
MVPYHHDDYYVRVSDGHYTFKAYLGTHLHNVAVGIPYCSLKRPTL